MLTNWFPPGTLRCFHLSTALQALLGHQPSSGLLLQRWLSCYYCPIVDEYCCDFLLHNFFIRRITTWLWRSREMMGNKVILNIVLLILVTSWSKLAFKQQQQNHNKKSARYFGGEFIFRVEHLEAAAGGSKLHLLLPLLLLASQSLFLTSILL